MATKPSGLALVEHAAGLEVYVMREIPSNVILAKAFAQRFAGSSIGSNNLTQLIFRVGRDSVKLAELFDEQDDAVRWMIQSVITEAHKAHLRADACRFDATSGSEFSRPGLEPPGIPATFSARCVRS